MSRRTVYFLGLLTGALAFPTGVVIGAILNHRPLITPFGE
jgi:hypothetical protein